MRERSAMCAGIDQESQWLRHVEPHLLDPDSRDALACAKEEAAEPGIPRNLMYEGGDRGRLGCGVELIVLADMNRSLAG